MKRIVSLVLILALVFTFGAGSAFAAGSSAGDTTATVMKIAGFEGKVSITTEKGKDVNVSDGTKLLSGYTVKTGAASYCYISLDDAKALKLDQNTKVKIEKSGKKIEINVKSGQLFFDVDKKLSGSESMNIKTSNLTTGVRGTSGTVKVALEKVLSAMQRAGSQRSQLANMLMPKTSLQLFSGFTEVKAGAGKAVATGLSAGQQLAVNKTADSAGGAAQTLVKGELVVDNFGARAIIENAAIKNGMSVGAALQASTEKIVEQVGAAVLDTLNVADSAKQQVTEMAGDPQALDKAIAEEQQQAAAKTEETMQAISDAKADAGSGNASSAASEQVFEKVEVSQNATIDAGKVSFEGGSVTVEDTAAQTSGSHSGGSSGSVVIPESGYLTGYTGAYDYFAGVPKRIFKDDPTVKYNESDIFVFDSVEEYTSFTAILAGAKANYEEVKASMAEAGEPEPDYYSMVVMQGLMSNPEIAIRYCNNDELGDSNREIGEVLYASDSGDYPYFAIGHMAPYEEKTGTLHVRITKQELSVRWFCIGENENETPAPESGTVFPSDLNGITDIKPEIGVVDDEGRFLRIDADIVGYDEDGDPLRISVGPGYDSGFDPAVNSGTMKVNSIEVPYFYAHPDEIIEPIGDPSGDPSGGIPYNPGGDPSGQIISVAEPAYVYETANFCLTGVYEYNYTIAPGWITGYTGTYDGEYHPAFNLTEDQANNYYIFCFDGSSSERAKYRNIATSWSALRSQGLSLEDTITRLSSTASGGFGRNFYDPAGSYETVRSVSHTGRYLYYAIPKQGNLNDIKTGGTPVVIEPADLYIGWGSYDPDTEDYTDVPSGSTLMLNDYGDIDVGPYTYMLGTGGAKVPVSLDDGYRLVKSDPVESADGLYTVKVTGVSRTSNKVDPFYDSGTILTPLVEGGNCPANDGNCNVIGSNLTFTYRLAAGNPITSQPILSSNIVGFADGYPQVACRADGFDITLKLAEAADTEVYGIFVGKRGNVYPDSYDVLHGHSNYVNQASALVYGRIDSADEETISIDFNEWQDADSGAFFAFILKQGNVISREPIFVAANSQFGGLYITGTENARDTVAPRILSAFLNSARNKIVVEMSEDVAVPINREGFGFTGGTGTISSVSVSTVSALSGRTRYFMELGVENLEGVNMGLTYNGTAVAGTAVADKNGNPMAAITAENPIHIQDSAVTIGSVAASEDRSLIRVDLTGRLLNPTTNGTYMIKYGTSWDNSTQIQGSAMDWTDEFRWNDNPTQQLGTTFFHIDEDRLPSEVPEGRFFVRLNSGSKNMALETIEVDSEPVEAASTLAATTQEPSPSAVYDSSDATLTLTFEEGSMLEAGSSIVGGAVNCRFYIIDGDGKLFRLRGNYTDRGVHSLVFDNTGEYGMSGFGFDPDEVNWEGATLGYTSEIHEDDLYIGYFDELLAADGTIITELTDIPITVVP